MIPNNEFIDHVNKWLSDKLECQKRSEVGDVELDVGPSDSVSNVS